MLAIFLKTLPFFALIGTGWLAGRLRLFSAEATAALTKFVFYFALSAMIHRFHYLKYALAAVLVLIGSKICVAEFVLGGDKFPPLLSLGVTAALIASGIAYSLWKTRGAPEPEWPK